MTVILGSAPVTTSNHGEGLPCPVCKAESYVAVRDIFDDRYGCPDLFQLVRCTSCGHTMTSPRLGEADLGPLYSTYYPRRQVVIADLIAAARGVASGGSKLRRWWEGTDNQGQYSVRPGEKILDLGCGSGLSLLEAQALGGEAYGIETDPNIRRIADALGLRIHIGNIYDQPFPGVQFDLIVLNQVIEHIPEPENTLEALKNRLKPGGRIILAFPNLNALSRHLAGERWIHWHIPFHLQHFDRSHFEQLAGRLGFKVNKVRTVTPNIWTLLQLRAFAFRPQRGQPNPMWVVEGPAPEVEGQAAAPATVQAISPTRRVKRAIRVIITNLMALAGRAVDATGMGDSIVVELKLGPTK